MNQRVTRAMLEHLGFHVDVVADGAEAVQAATPTPYDAILMDCQIPVLDGYQATAEIRSCRGPPSHPHHRGDRLGAKSDEQRCLAAGMDDYLAEAAQPALAPLARRLPVGRRDPRTSRPVADASSASTRRRRAAGAGCRRRRPPRALGKAAGRPDGPVGHTVPRRRRRADRRAAAGARRDDDAAAVARSATR